jgi:hypothetical protein
MFDIFLVTAEAEESAETEEWGATSVLLSVSE